MGGCDTRGGEGEVVRRDSVGMLCVKGWGYCCCCVGCCCCCGSKAVVGMYV